MLRKLFAIEITVLRGLGVAALIAAGFTTNAVADEADPYSMADNTWITLSGEVESVDRDSFMLDYGDGYILVEMDDGDRDADAYKLLKGDKVTVSGRIDDDFFETTKIEAGSVYVENIGTTFFASSVDEETSEQFVAAISVPVVVSETVVQGTVTDVARNEFTVDAGLKKLRVDVSDMPFDPLDEEGYLKVDVGDRVRVSGEIDNKVFEGRELVADTIIVLNH